MGGGELHRREISRLRPAPANGAGKAETRGTPLGMTATTQRGAATKRRGPCREADSTLHAKHVCRAQHAVPLRREKRRRGGREMDVNAEASITDVEAG